ncbi:putative alkaline shock family protein YloU [Geodermatophilus bullaregiensis]|uniref:Asp23/Gls24 family envelope stress response protein n=1 Tax=Geodermatophilus bullaregiensis TaxID=1564160 RepID=UPI0019564799|nr:Asp23/Gls24 family envelope stress response protein [Geodermatophilus bullaregiensis]MBM7804681.1 putative alkaline shock family protein YloU [Geodermatophilus bullaregiensis]
MSSPTATSTSASTAVATKQNAGTTSGTQLTTTQGRTTIADTVVSKIAGMATREVNGVHRLGGGVARAFGAIRERIPGSGGPNVSQGVSVEVGETQAAVDIDIVAEYGVPIADLASGIRRNVISSLERMTGLEVVEVNISVNDVHLPTDEDTEQQPQPSRVA